MLWGRVIRRQQVSQVPEVQGEMWSVPAASSPENLSWPRGLGWEAQREKGAAPALELALVYLSSAAELGRVMTTGLPAWATRKEGTLSHCRTLVEYGVFVPVGV